MGEENKVIKVRLELHAQQLKNLAGGIHGGKSDPFAIVTLLANDPTAKPVILGKTEVYVRAVGSLDATVIMMDFMQCHDIMSNRIAAAVHPTVPCDGTNY